MTIQQYITNITAAYNRGTATEHTYRGDLAKLIETILPEYVATNEPKRQKCGAPDYIITKKNIEIGYIEAKDIGDNDLMGEKKTGNKEQFDRYKTALPNIIFTDYICFHFFDYHEYKTTIEIAKVENNTIIPLPENYERFEKLIKNYGIYVGQTIKNPEQLAAMMAGKAKLLADVMEKSLFSDQYTFEDSTLKDQLMSFRDVLIHDITNKQFADVYAQTIVYGMFAARLHDVSLPTFSRQEAAELIPKSNPFLRKLFGYIAGPDIDDRIVWIVDSLVEIFLACDVYEILKNYGKNTQTEDPIIHFYETFLGEYDPSLRKARGVWYTPKPVVNFIVRAVDDILKDDFGLKDGLATTDKVKVKNFELGLDQEVHKVQILDPATGTGTFLVETIKQIHKKFEGQQGIWSNYVKNDLIPRLNGFELLMASYAMAHLQIDLLLTETGYKPSAVKGAKQERMKIYLTNSLEQGNTQIERGFTNWLTAEANEANDIKRNVPVMCVMGNPPYSGVSQNNNSWISSLIETYKYVDKIHFNERKHWLNDDYVKFIRLGQDYIDKNGSGVLAFINPHGYLDNPTFRGMRWNLLKSFNKIYTIDLHGNSKKKETAPDGSIDQNVFDIMQGVSINIFVKTAKKKVGEYAEVFHYDLYGKRNLKYDFLLNNSLKTVKYTKLKPSEPNYFFIPKSNKGIKQYEKGFKVDALFALNGTGIVTARDKLVINESKTDLLNNIKRFTNLSYTDFDIRKYFFGNKQNGKYLAGDSRGWKLTEARENIKNNNHSEVIKTISYRPFDDRSIYYSSDMVDWGRERVMQNFINNDNLGLVIPRFNQEENCVFISNKIIAHKLCSAYDSNSLFPLYLYPTNGSLDKEAIVRTPNLNMDIVKQIEKKLKTPFVAERHCEERSNFNPTSAACVVPCNDFAPIDILDYIYAVLHSPTYREQYNEFLKIDFPRVPFPENLQDFWNLVGLGSQLRQIHLLESEVVNKYITQYPKDGNNIIEKVSTVEINQGLSVRVYINDSQYFDNVPDVAWNFYIGGYQPAQKWLKDRKDRVLNYEDILHYQKIIVALTETDRLMKEIELIKLIEV
jgi:predicted helicase